MACAITVPPEYLSAYSVLYELVHALSMSIPPTPLMVTAGGLPDLANLTLREVEPLTNAVACLSEENIATAASKRKSVSTSTDPSSTSSTASNIVRHDSGQLSVRLILLSRLLDVRNHEKLMTLSNTGIGGALLAMLRDIFLQAARAIGGDTAQALTPTNVESIFNATGSMLVRPPMYAAQLSVPGRLPFAAATVLYQKLLMVLTAERDELAKNTKAGLPLLTWLMSKSITDQSALVHSLGTSIEARLRTALTVGTGGASGTWSTSSASNYALSSDENATDTLPMPPPSPMPPSHPMPPTLPMSPSPALPPLLPQATLRENLIRLVSTMTGATLSGPTQRDVNEALERGLGMINSTARPLLDMPLLDALLHSAGAQLLAELIGALPQLENVQTHSNSIEGFLDRLLRGCDCVASMHCSAAAIAQWIDEDALAALSGDGDDRGGW